MWHLFLARLQIGSLASPQINVDIVAISCAPASTIRGSSTVSVVSGSESKQLENMSECEIFQGLKMNLRGSDHWRNRVAMNLVLDEGSSP